MKNFKIVLVDEYKKHEINITVEDDDYAFHVDVNGSVKEKSGFKSAIEAASACKTYIDELKGDDVYRVNATKEYVAQYTSALLVSASSPEEAVKKASNGDFIYEVEVDEKTLPIEYKIKSVQKNGHKKILWES